MAVLVVIHGRVQGVGYRWWAVQEARRLGLAGWVRNRRDGSVEACLEGDAPSVAVMSERCKSGPAMARVERVEVSETSDSGAVDFVEAASV